MRIPKGGNLKIDYCTFVLCLTTSTIITYQIISHFIPIDDNCVLQKHQRPLSSKICINDEIYKCVPPFLNFDSKFRIAQNFSLAACVIEKSMSTVMAAIMCLLHDEGSFRGNNRSLTTDIWENRFCKGKNEYKSMKEITVKTKTKIEEWQIFAVVRDPVERFLSGFVDKCILETKRNMKPNKCYGCEQNMTCFLQEEYSRAMAFANGKSKLQSYEDIHFFPQNWHCEFNSFYNRIKIIRYESHSPEEYSRMLDKIGSIFQGNLVSDQTVAAIKNELLASKRTKHSTQKSPEREYYTAELKKNKAAMELLIRLYYFDFILFGFPLPDI